MSAPGPAIFDTGFTDDYNFQAVDGPTRLQWFERAHRAGSSWVRLAVPWNLIAPDHPPRSFHPSDPADGSYRWSNLDISVRDASASGQHILMMINTAPTWAERHPPRNAIPGAWNPSPVALAAFSRAVALRYSGRFPDPLNLGRTLPKVTDFQVWNEPNLRVDLQPQWTRVAHGRYAGASPGMYRAMLNAAYASIKQVQPHADVMAAGTAPYGDPPGVDRMRPVEFWRELLCLKGPQLRPVRCSNPVHLDSVDHHPYGLRPGISAANRDDVAVPDISRLQRVLAAAEHHGTVLPRGHKPFWVTEISWTSRPPDSVGVPLSVQAGFVDFAFATLWRQGVSRVLWLEVGDYPYKSLTGSGVYFRSGAAKPAVAAFRFPFIVLRDRRDRTALIWGRAPGRGGVAIEARRGGRWSTIAHTATSAGGIFYLHRALAPGTRLRARIGRTASPSWRLT